MPKYANILKLVEFGLFWLLSQVLVLIRHSGSQGVEGEVSWGIWKKEIYVSACPADGGILRIYGH